MNAGRVRRGLGSAVAAVLFASLPSVSGVPAAEAVAVPHRLVAAAPQASAKLTAAKPKIKGVAAVGSTLSAKPGKWSAKVKFTFQWYAAGKAIKKATKPTFKPTKTQVGKKLTVKVTGKLGVAKTSKTSAATAKVLLAGTPTVAGKLTVGSKVTVARGSWTSAVKFSYAWLRDGLAVPGAKGSSYLVVASQAGHKLSVKVTGKRSGYATVTKTSAAVIVPGDTPTPTPTPPTPEVPTISGSAVVGSTLVADAGKWTDGTVLSYQWLRNGTAIAGATDPSYLLVSEDAKQQVSVAVTGTLGSTSETKTSAAVTVGIATLTAATPKIDGTIAVSKTLTAVPGAWTAGTSFTYQWLADGAPVTRGTTSTLRPGYLEAGRTLTVTVTGSKDGYDTVTKTSAPVTIPTEGNYEVGVDIPEGTFNSTENEECAWSQLRYSFDPNGENPGDIYLSSRWTNRGPALVELAKARPWLWTHDCGRWVPATQPAVPSTSFGDGDYLIGTQVQPGEYESTGITEKCVLYLARGTTGVFKDDYRTSYIQQGGKTTMRVDVVATDKRVTSFKCGTWTRVGGLS